MHLFITCQTKLLLINSTIMPYNLLIRKQFFEQLIAGKSSPSEWVVIFTDMP